MKVQEILDTVDSWDVKAVSEAEFQAAADKVKAVTNLSDDQKLIIYG